MQQQATGRFIFASILGMLAFIVPLSDGNKWTIGLGIASDFINSKLVDIFPQFILTIILTSSLLTLVYFFKPFGGRHMALLFKTTSGWVIGRLMGAIFTLLIYSQVGPAMIIAPATGGTMFKDLAPALVILFVLAGLMLPFLTDYGLMEFIGTLLRKPFKTLFRVPGRAAVDAVASWMGSGTVGVVITTQQYAKGYYNKREAAVIATNFSIVSTAFCLTIAKFMRLDHVFFQYYFSIIVCGIVAALIMPRIPPLSRIADDYKEGVTPADIIRPDDKQPLLPLALKTARDKAATAPSYGHSLIEGLFTGLFIWTSLLPIVMLVGTLSLMIAEYTSLFQILSTPFIWILEAVHMDEATSAAPAMLIGFADQFLPAIIGKDIVSDVTRFTVGILAVTQLIYMSEVGIILMQSGLPLSFGRLAIIFLLRTIIVLPLAIMLAYYFMG